MQVRRLSGKSEARLMLLFAGWGMDDAPFAPFARRRELGYNRGVSVPFSEGGA